MWLRCRDTLTGDGAKSELLSLEAFQKLGGHGFAGSVLLAGKCISVFPVHFLMLSRAGAGVGRVLESQLSSCGLQPNAVTVSEVPQEPCGAFSRCCAQLVAQRYEHRTAAKNAGLSLQHASSEGPCTSHAEFVRGRHSRPLHVTRRAYPPERHDSLQPGP